MDNPRLKPEQYWEWRTSIAEMQLAEKDYKANQLQYGCILKDIEIAQLKANIYKNTTLNGSETKKKQLKEEYEKFRAKLESEIGMSLKNCTIDDVTFEIRQLEPSVSEEDK